MDPKRLLLVMAERLYEDIKFVTQQNPTQIVDDDGARAYNALLAKTRKYFPYVEFLQDFPDWQARTIKYKDALVVAGQLHAMLKAIHDVAAHEDFQRTSTGSVKLPTAAAIAVQPAPVAPVAPHPAPAPPVAAAPPPPPPPPPPAVVIPAGTPATASVSASRSASASASASVSGVPALPPAPPSPLLPRKPMQPVAAPPVSSPGARGAVENEHDEELYGPRPIRRREDGTIPFSME